MSRLKVIFVSVALSFALVGGVQVVETVAAGPADFYASNKVNLIVPHSYSHLYCFLHEETWRGMVQIHHNRCRQLAICYGLFEYALETTLYRGFIFDWMGL